MSWLQPKLHLRVAQKQILTPGLVQMVSVLALNRLELREMINQEMIENPVLEELSEESVTPEDYSDETFLKAETEKIPEVEPPSPFEDFDVASFFNQYLDSGGGNPEILLPNLVYAIAHLSFRGLDLESVLLGGGREEAPDRMFLPIRGFHDLGQRCSLGPPDQFQNFCAFALGARRAGFLGPGGFGGPLSRVGFLLR